MADAFTVRLVGDGLKKLHGFEAAFPSIARKGVNGAALAVKTEVTRTLYASGVPGRLSGVGKKGARLGVRYDIKGTTDPTALVRATGPWQLVEGPTQPHIILSKKLGTRRRRSTVGAGLFVAAPGQRLGGRTGAVLTPQGPRAYARHPGTTGKYPWKRGTATASKLSMQAYDDALKTEMRRYFRGG